MNRIAVVKNEFSCPFMEEELAKEVTIPYSNYQDKIESLLQKYGFVVVTDILSAQEISEAINLVYDDLMETIDEKAKYDPKLNDVIKKVREGEIDFPYMSLPGIVRKGFLSTNGFPQGKCAWTLRTNEKTRKIFEHLHK